VHGHFGGSSALFGRLAGGLAFEDRVEAVEHDRLRRALRADQVGRGVRVGQQRVEARVRPVEGDERVEDPVEHHVQRQVGHG
jgi:hypothetical protein